MTEQATIYFDSTYRLRVVEEDKYKDTERLHEECGLFTDKMGGFQQTVQRLVDGMNDYAGKIEAAKLKALGQRNRVESEVEVRKRRTAELQALINEKKAGLERLQLQHESLKKVDAEQKATIERLSNNEA
mmetsp:Transcript_12278/g.24267  ORF Transcript_12278/g.24267 Transcript_12278/m.24267 type:complete len:130 (+) Transcript_12278:219-608(+)|eukprot:CAMPEP_0173380104 /NCGR_PEP_ID=MMETSP1356-20130122/2860_1 /TAXON_ID=77927 ORGANISM="Hemiselmis virescens, Strain PCC157" /NCGR_SAMPLE_ID=MMETSP1356 /ASSEMBLY_ACC=CAM_ASM_000847 /LENGTH=129 /DNA_ID=CAMNT_0014333593 /DNA_START=219 /DNA_END=608 /DNA_ORIENTATION=-